MSNSEEIVDILDLQNQVISGGTRIGAQVSTVDPNKYR
jgi:hypothetical protein